MHSARLGGAGEREEVSEGCQVMCHAFWILGGGAGVEELDTLVRVLKVFVVLVDDVVGGKVWKQAGLEIVPAK